MKFILGKKLDMDQVWDEKGIRIPITWIEVKPCQVTQIKSKEKDGYTAVQIGCGEKSRLNKPLGGHLKDLPKFRYLREFRIENSETFQRGQEIKVTIFKPGEKVVVAGISKGKGFQGVVKRHGFAGSPATHGHKDQLRMPGSIGATDPQRVFLGTRMGGRMGCDRVTVKNLEIIQIDEAGNRIALKGAVPGAKNSLIELVGE